LLLLALLATGAGADTLILKDGKKLEGTVTEQGDAYEVQTRQGKVTVRKAEVQEVQKGASAGAKTDAPAGANDEKAAADLLASAEELIKKKSLTEAKSVLERIGRQYPASGVAGKARDLLTTMPNAFGRLVLGFDNAAEAQAETLVGTRVQVEFVSDAKQVKAGAGAAHVVMNSGTKATLIMFRIPEQNLEKMKGVSFWMYSEARLHQKRVLKFCLVSPSQATPNYFDANIVGADENGWKRIQVVRGQFKGEGGGFAADLSNGLPSWRKIVGIGFLLPPENVRDFVIDDVRILE
jgi:hypothetical protein